MAAAGAVGPLPLSRAPVAIRMRRPLLCFFPHLEAFLSPWPCRSHGQDASSMKPPTAADGDAPIFPSPLPIANEVTGPCISEFYVAAIAPMLHSAPSDRAARVCCCFRCRCRYRCRVALDAIVAAATTRLPLAAGGVSVHGEEELVRDRPTSPSLARGSQSNGINR